MSEPSFTLPLPVRALNAIAPAFAGGGQRLRPERLLASVEGVVGDTGLLPSRVTDALEVLCRAYADEANLHFWGEIRMGSMIRDALVQRVLLDRTFRERPQLAETPLVPPLFVTGLYRSGTTFLHRMLVAAGGSRPVTMGELLTPFPVPGQRLSVARENALKFRMLQWTSSPDLDAMHYTRPGLAEECVVALRMDLRSMLLWRSAPIPSYHRWLFQENLGDTYRMYRRLLQHLQAATPDARLTLKAPMHLIDLGSLVSVFPEAMVVHTHRDPVDLVPSDHKLAFAFHDGVTRGVDRTRIVETNTQGLAEMAERSVDAHDGPFGGRLCDVSYPELVRDPVGTVRAIYGFFGLPFTADVEARTEAFVATNPRNKHGANRYTPEAFGQTRVEIERRFRRYRERFVPAPWSP